MQEEWVKRENVQGFVASSDYVMMKKEISFVKTRMSACKFALGMALFKNSTPAYWHVHSANGALHGNAFMNIDLAARGNRGKTN